MVGDGKRRFSRAWLGGDCWQVWWSLAYDFETYVQAMSRQSWQDAKDIQQNKYWQTQVFTNGFGMKKCITFL